MKTPEACKIDQMPKTSASPGYGAKKQFNGKRDGISCVELQPGLKKCRPRGHTQRAQAGSTGRSSEA
ncbi:hypothetical protein [Prosthecochloris vibrioformis]|uniref:Uncharacterized protein n=1 Tax=Prosthecochloris vibrioformis TaxID=1098 RepID=A0A5C4RZY9_PROVB|nr:hypothetical protein [Prosthecochloris vibrioformis]TNJ36522.1 hypothetical protein FGF68_07310 [Prosthecochloris vibrioformis]